MSNLGVYLLRRVLLMVPVLFGVTLATFLLVNLVPGGVLEQKARLATTTYANAAGAGGGPAVSAQVLAALKRQYGLDRPIEERYGIWLRKLARFDFGESFDYKRPVIDVIVERFPVSLQFGLTSFVLTYVIAIGLGLAMARRAGSWLDRLMRGCLMVGAAVPPFTLAIVLLVFFAGGTFFHWFPSGFLQSEHVESYSVAGRVADRVWHFVLPLIAYMAGSLASLTVLTRNSLLGEIRKDYVRTALGIGESWSAIYHRLALKNAALPIVTGIGGFLGVFFSGSLLIENIFQLNGIGRLGYQSLLSRDHNMIMALTFLQSLAVLAGNLLGDLIYIWLDPRIAYD